MPIWSMRELNMTRFAKDLIASLQQAVAQSGNRKTDVAKTRSFKELVQHHVEADPAFAEALLREGNKAMREGDIETGNTILRNSTKAKE
jgi:hypothetical protein